MTFTDDQLRAYLDGKAPEAEAVAIEAERVSSPDFEARLMALDTLAAPVRQVFQSVPASIRVSEMVPAPRENVSQRSGWMAAGIGLLAGLVLGIAGLTLAPFSNQNSAPELGWRMQVALYQALYTPDTISHLNTDPAVLDAQFQRASAALGRDLSVDDLEDLPGLDLRRAQVLAFGDRALVQIVFGSDDGAPVAFCIITGGADAPQPAAFEELAGLSTSHWANGGYGYMVLGAIAPEDVRAMTDLLTAQF